MREDQVSGKCGFAQSRAQVIAFDQLQLFTNLQIQATVCSQ